MTHMIARSVRTFARSSSGRFVIDFWYSPRAAWPRYRRRRSWPSREELDAMSVDEFEGEMQKLGIAGNAAASVEGRDAGEGRLLAQLSIGAGDPVTSDPGGPGHGGGGDREGSGSRASSGVNCLTVLSSTIRSKTC